MGSGRWSARDWATYSSRHIHSKTSTTGASGIYSSSHMVDELDPKKMKNGIRESRDSVDNPNSTPIIIGLDVTGSMDRVLDAMARTGLPTLATEIYNRKPVTDPHILMAGIGDAYFDDAPLQVTQFEADIRIAEQLTKIWLERGGGGNDFEGYALLWYFASRHTEIDSMEKRGKKGYLFTVGDERPTAKIPAEHIEKVFGYKSQTDFTSEDLLKEVSRKYEVFHLIVEEGSGFRYDGDEVLRQWRDLLGQRAIRLKDHTKMGEVIVSLLQVLGGEDKDKVARSWDGSTSLVVREAIKDVTPVGSASSGLVTFD